MGGRGKKRIGRIPKKRQQKKINKPGHPKRKPKGVVESLSDVKNVVSSLSAGWSDQSEGDEARFIKLKQGSGEAQSL